MLKNMINLESLDFEHCCCM